MNKKLVAATMVSMAESNRDFKVIYDFFMELQGCDKRAYLVVCRARMAHVGDSLAQVPGLGDSALVSVLRKAATLDDAGIVRLSASLLDIVTKSVELAIRSRL